MIPIGPNEFRMTGMFAEVFQSLGVSYIIFWQNLTGSLAVTQMKCPQRISQNLTF